MVKVNYVKMSAGGKAAAGKSADYYAHRPDKEGGREYRPGFDAENEEMPKNEVYERIEQGEGDYTYRIVLSPGQQMEAEELREWVRDVMEPVEEQGGEWVGFVHDDHTDAHGSGERPTTDLVHPGEQTSAVAKEQALVTQVGCHAGS